MATGIFLSFGLLIILEASCSFSLKKVLCMRRALFDILILVPLWLSVETELLSSQ